MATPWGGFNAQNIFDDEFNGDLNPVAPKYGLSRDELAGQRNDFLQSKYSQYRGAVGDMAADDDVGLFNDQNFRNYVQQGQLPQAPAQAQAPQQPAAPSPAQPSERNRSLWDSLMSRANQGLNANRNDPAIRAQADAYSANEQRAARNFLGDVAERSPGANLRGEQRLAAERVGQRTAGFEADLLGRDVQARRNEIAQALEGMRGMVSQEDEAALREKLALMDQAIREKGVGLEQSRMNQQQDQFLRDLGLRDWDRQMYWDQLQRGNLG